MATQLVLRHAWALCGAETLCRAITTARVHLSMKGPDMNPAADTGRGFSAVPLLNAVFCVDCEIISNSPHDACTVCGSHSLISLFRMLGGTLRGQKAESTEDHAKVAKYTLEITAKVHEIPATGLNLLIELLTRLVEVGGAVESLHLNVEPIVDTRGILRAA